MTTDFGVDPRYVQVDGTKAKVARRGVMALAIVIAANLVLVALAVLLDPRVDGPPGSSIVTTAGGYGAWHDTLEELGFTVRRLRVPLAEAEVATEPGAAAGAVLVVAQPDFGLVDDAYLSAVQRFVDDGGRVIATPDFARLLTSEVGANGATLAGVGAELVVTTGVADVERLAIGVEASDIGSGGVPIVSTADDRPLVVGFEPGVTVVVPSLFENQTIGIADNAVLAVRLVGQGPVYFDEHVHGFTAGRGIGAVQGVAVFFAGLLVAAVVWMWSVGARFGPPEQQIRALPPARADYLDAVAVTLAKTGADEQGYGQLRAKARDRIDRLSDRYAALPVEQRRLAAARAAGLTADELDALDGRVESKSDAIRVATAAAKIESTRIGSNP